MDFAFCWQSKVVWESIATLYYLKLAWIVGRKRVVYFYDLTFLRILFSLFYRTDYTLLEEKTLIFPLRVALYWQFLCQNRVDGKVLNPTFFEKMDVCVYTVINPREFQYRRF